MSVNYSTGAKTVLLESGFDTAFNSGVLEIRSGAKPASANNAPSGTLLMTVALPADAFAAASAGAKAKTGSWPIATYVATGTAAHFRLKSSTDGGASSTTDARIDGDITLTAGGGDLTLTDVAIDATKSVTIASFVFTLP